MRHGLARILIRFSNDFLRFPVTTIQIRTDNRFENVCLGTEIIIDSRDAEASALRDSLHGRPAIADFPDQLLSRLKDGSPSFLFLTLANRQQTSPQKSI